MTVVPVQVRDIYEHRRVGRKLVRTFTGFLEWYLRRYPEKAHDDPTNLARLLAYSSPGMRAWAQYMPGGVATHHAHRPQDKKLVNGKQIDVITRNFFRHTHESVGLRSRADVLAWLVVQQCQEDTRDISWVSMACGSGQPVYDTLALLGENKARQASLLMTDIDATMLQFAEEVYKRQKLPVRTIRFAAIDAFASEMQRQIEQMHPTVIDAMGLFEYLDESQAVCLLGLVWEALPPSSQFVFCNMRSDHPLLQTHKRALGWPGVIQRSVDDFSELCAAAGIPLERVDAYQPQDGVYNIYRVRK